MAELDLIALVTKLVTKLKADMDYDDAEAWRYFTILELTEAERTLVATLLAEV